MVSVEEAVIARLERNGINFEILVDPEKALEFKKGKDLDMVSILAVQEVFRDSKKGERSSDEDLEKVFKTTSVTKVAAEIIRHGDIQLTTDQRRKMIEEKRKQIADIISKQGINPKTKLPHPPQRIINAMEEARVNIDPFKPAQDQVKHVVEKIQEVIPISIAKLEVALKIPIQYAGKANSVVRSITDVKKEEWKSDCWYALIEIPAGMQSEIYSRLNELTSGKAEIKVVKSKQL